MVEGGGALVEGSHLVLEESALPRHHPPQPAARPEGRCKATWKGNSNSHGARPVHLIITMIKRIRTSRLSIKNSLSAAGWRRGSTTPPSFSLLCYSQA